MLSLEEISLSQFQYAGHGGVGAAALDINNLQQAIVDSPVSWLYDPSQEFFPSNTNTNNNANKKQQQSTRHLDDNDNDGYLVDEDGNDYEPYSLAWRYLGMYMECNGDSDNQEDDDASQDERRMSQDNDSDSDCTRKVLWAAYHDPGYSEGTIGEYQFYNHTTGEYDDDYCKTERCVPLNCHEPDTHFQLVGVYKETDGMEYFTEQLFKHQGYCLWDSNEYEFMQTYQAYLPTYCKQLYFPDDDGNALYVNVRPQAEANVGIGVYTDDMCTRLSTQSTIQSYIEMFYDINGNAQKGQQIARAWTKALRQWNQKMNVYKTCQPCRAYSLYSSDDDDAAGEERFLNEDGEGDEEQWGYDCYDDAGYTNCNQCYKFFTQTDLEQADESDLAAASKQGTILEIRVNGKRYGKGGFHPHFIMPKWAGILISTLGVIAVVGSLALLFRRYGSSAMIGTILQWLRARFVRKDLPSSFKEHFHLQDETSVVEVENDDGLDAVPLSYAH